MKKPLIGLKQHIVGNRKAIALKVDGRQIQVIILNSAWKDNYHLILEEIEGMTAIKSAHLVVDKKELLKELADDKELVNKIIDKLDNFHLEELISTAIFTKVIFGLVENNKELFIEHLENIKK